MQRSIRKILRQWYIPFIVGLFFITIAIGIFSFPQTSITVLLFLFGFTLMAFGLREALFIYGKKRLIKGWEWYFASSLFTISIGILLMIKPLTSIVFIHTLIILWLFSKALQNLLFHRSFPRKTRRIMGMSWIYSLTLLLIAFFLWSRPEIISASFVVLSGLPFLIIGITCISLSFILKKGCAKLESFKKSFHNNTEEIEFEIVD